MLLWCPNVRSCVVIKLLAPRRFWRGIRLKTLKPSLPPSVSATRNHGISLGQRKKNPVVGSTNSPTNRFWRRKKCCPCTRVFFANRLLLHRWRVCCTTCKLPAKSLKAARLYVPWQRAMALKIRNMAIMQCADAKPVTIEANLDAVKRAILDVL